MSGAPWYQYGLGPTNMVRLTFAEEPTADDLETLIEFVRLHLKGVRRAEDAAGQQPPTPSGDQGGER